MQNPAYSFCSSVSLLMSRYVCVLAALPLLILFVFNGWAFSSSGFSIGTVALTTLALKSSYPGFGAFSVDTRYCLIAVVVHQKTWGLLLWEVQSSQSLVQNRA